MGLITWKSVETAQQQWSCVANYCDPEPTCPAWGAKEPLVAYIGNNPSKTAFGTVKVAGTAATIIHYFSATNTGSRAVDIVIYGTSTTGGGDTWVLTDEGNPGEDIFVLAAGLNEDDDIFDVIVRQTASYSTLPSSLVEDATQDWGLELAMPTSLNAYEEQQMTATLTLVASETS